MIITIFFDRTNFLNIFSKEIQIYKDPGLLNNVNTYRGYAREDGLETVAKIAENKYLFFSEFLIIKVLRNLAPSAFFSQQERLLGFSFSPPLFLGFVIPFFLGLYELIKNRIELKLLALTTVLTIPSVLSGLGVDLNRLFIFYPVILFIVTYGAQLLYQRIKGATTRIWIYLAITLILFQFGFTLFDIGTKEISRYKSYGEIVNQYFYK